MSEYTPTVGELRQAYVEASGASMAQESYYAEQLAEFERGIAKIKADALRGAIEDIDAAGLNAYTANEVVSWLSARADQIEEEAGR